MPKKTRSGKDKDARIGYGRARPAAGPAGRHTIAMVTSPGGTVSQPEQLSSSRVTGVETEGTPGGKRRVAAVETEGGHRYKRRATMRLEVEDSQDPDSDASTNSPTIARRSLQLDFLSPEQSEESRRAILTARMADRRKTHHGGGSSKYLRPKVDVSGLFIEDAGIESEVLSTAVSSLASTEIATTAPTILDPNRPKDVRKKTANIMGRSARVEFANLLEQVDELDLNKLVKDHLKAYLQLNVDKLQVEWAHLTAHSHGTADETDTRANLGASTERANTAMNVTEAAASSLAREEFPVLIQTRFSKFLGTEILNIIEHVMQVTSKDKTRTIQLVNSIANLAAPDWIELPKTTDPAVVATVLRAMLESKPPRATFRPR